jgi:hypothetical protein
MTGFMKFTDLSKVGIIGLNIEGNRPSFHTKADWYNLILAVDEPLQNITFDDVMNNVKRNQYQYIEEAIADFNMNTYILQITTIVQRIQQTHQYKQILVHIHQYQGTTQLDQIIAEKTGIKTILDKTNFFDTPVDYSKEYPEIDCLISFSQCAHGCNM